MSTAEGAGEGLTYVRLLEHLGRRHAWAQGGTLSMPELTQSLLTPVLAGRWLYPFVSLIRDGLVPATSSWTHPTSLPGLSRPLPREIVRLMREGHTLKVQNVELGVPGVREVVLDLERRTGRCGSAVFFMTPDAGTGLSPHHDDTDVIIEQVQGAKRWNLWEPAGPPPREPGKDTQPVGRRRELLLHPGDLLLVPRGWTHCARAEGGSPSVHISYCLRETGEQQGLSLTVPDV